MAPVARIVSRFRAACPHIPIIGFPKGAGSQYEAFRQNTGVDALGLDWTVPLRAARALQAGGAVQGNLDPMRLVAGGSGLEARVREIVDALRARPHIFNLGHGVVPETPIAHVEQVLRVLKGGA